MKHAIYTHSGHLFDFDAIEKQEIHIDDIVYSLAQTNRFCGRTPYPYSVAQHSLLVEALCFTEDGRFHALLHDAAEAYVGDMPTPLKRLLPEYRAIEDRVQARIFERFKFNPKRTRAEVEWADHAALVCEVIMMLPSEDYTLWGFTRNEVEWAKGYIADGSYIEAVGRYEIANVRWSAHLAYHVARLFIDAAGNQHN